MKDRPRILDGCCGAGGASSGYRRAGLIPFGVDIARQPRYPYQFVRADILDYLKRYGREFDVIHVSPPCQGYSNMKAFVRYEYPLMIAPLRELLEDIGRPYIIENVEGARVHMQRVTTLCGVMFPELRVYRHRLFESNILLSPPYVCNGNHHDSTPPAGQGFSPKGYVSITSGGIRGVSKVQRSAAMGINWMTNDEAAESFPPHYTHWLGCQVMQHLGLEPLSWPKTRAVQNRMFA